MEIKNSMLSKLDPYRNKLDPKAEAAGVKTRGGGAAETGGAQQAATGDKVSLSSAARLHTTAHAEANKAPDVRQEKVDGIKERIASGSYTPDAKDIARKLVESEVDFASALKD